MNTSWLILLLGVLLGLGFGGTVAYLWGYRNGHLDGYQEHRAETIEFRNAADARRAPRTELKVRAKTGPPDPAWMLATSAAYDIIRNEASCQSLTTSAYSPGRTGSSRRFPTASPRVATTAADIGPVIVPATGATVIPLRPQPSRDSGPGTVTMPRLTDTGAMRALTDETDALIARIRAGTWP